MGQERVHAFTDDALGQHDAVGLAEQLQAGRVSAVELADAAIARLEAVNPQLNGLACADYDRARLRAAELDRQRGQGRLPGFLAGLPTLVKDNVDVAGLPTQQGSTAYRGRPAEADGDFARVFLGQGLVNLGKSQLSEFGWSASAESPTLGSVRNPWNTAYTSGASSAGSAALVAAGAVPLAHANDGGGSIRIPAACCGLVGLKPTRGRIAQDKMVREMPVQIVADGVVTRSVRDTAAYLREAERFHRHLKLPPVGDVRGPGSRPLKVAVVTESVGGRAVDPEVLAAVEDAATVLQDLGHRIELAAAPVPDSFADDFLVYWSLLSGFIVATGRRSLDPSFDRSLTENLTRGLAGNAARNAWRVPGAIARLRASRRLSARFFEQYDLVLSPVLAKPVVPLGWLDGSQSYEVIIERLLEWVAFTPLQNATGDPAISLPFGLDARGLPLAVQLGAGAGREARLLEVAYAVEEARPFPVIRPEPA